MLAVTFCVIGWLNVSVKPCVFCSSVIFCERKIVGYSQWGVLSLTERTEFTEPFGAHFELTEGLRHTEFTEAFQLRLAVTFCEIGWLNVSVDFCVFCSSVFSVRKRTIAKLADEFFSHRTHRFNRTFLRTVSNSQNASGIQSSQRPSN